ncbi:universal stress protein [Phenylobacterium sp.]|uniref:universal stress protein n=1 Tax=Phenylobacterium sp. TaxID=1871053 RepID=UPI002899B677|nr:universal stress protein [Phenylobacterium sp.]
MSDPGWTHNPPKKILLATDLSARCDRALDRASQLAAEWRAELLVLHVLDPAEGFIERRHLDDLPSWRRPTDRRALAEARVRRDLPEAHGAFTVLVKEGDPAAVIDETARSEGCELIVTGVARDETLGRSVLGATVDRLVRRSPVPVLVVKARAKPYRQIVVATDFSDSSRHALTAAMTFFPLHPVTLIHAFEVPFAGFIDKRRAEEQFRAMGLEAAGEFMTATMLTDDQRRGVEVLVEYGPPERVIRLYAEDMGADLVVLGTHGHSAVFDVLIGSTAKRILEQAPSDVLLIREPRSTPR